MNPKDRELLVEALWQQIARKVRGAFVARGVQSANRVLAGPVSGTPADPTWRMLVTADLPDLGVTGAKIANSTIDPATKLTGVVPAASGGTGVANTNTLTLTGGNNIKIGRGASFPSSPASGDIFNHTGYDDGNGMLFTYNGSSWLSEPSNLPFDSPYAIFPVGASGLVKSAQLHENVTLRLVRWSIKTYVATTNNSTNYWTVYLRKQDTSGTSTTIATLHTNVHGTNTNYRQSTTTFTGGATVGGSANFVLFIEVLKVGTPGGLYVDSALRVREVGS